MVDERLRTQKDNLARLMATEDLTIVHKAIPTAYFDVKNRVLACPVFKDDISPELYDLFMGHEVGHALNTPYEGLHSTIMENRTLKGYLNVIEDVRIEKAIKEKYQGLRGSFFKAYNELMDKDFFGIKEKDLQELSMIDKINLITKCGSRVDIIQDTILIHFLEKAEACKTWEDVVEVATEIYEWSKKFETRDETDEQITFIVPDEMLENGDDEGEEEQTEETSSNWETEDEETEDPDGDNTDSFGAPINPDKEEEEKAPEPGTEPGEDLEDEVKVTGKEGGNFTGRYDEPEGARESLTEYNAHNNEEEFVDKDAVIRTTIPIRERFENKKVNNVLYDYKTVLEDWREYFTGEDLDKQLEELMSNLDDKKKQGWRSEHNEKKKVDRRHFLVLAEHYKKYIQNKNKKIVAHMAKEFEMRQTAQRNAKAFTGKSGELDMNRLAKYQIVDDIFKRVTYIPDGKNHGLNVLVDWSGSISREVSDLLEQSLVLAEFCRKVQIPFRVYLFSDAIRRKDGDPYRSSGKGKLVEILSNEQSHREYNEMFVNLSSILVSKLHQDITYSWRQKEIPLIEEYNRIFSGVQTWDREAYYNDKQERCQNYEMYPDHYRLGGTPLDHCLVAMRKFLPEFNHAYGVEKSILTIITDGYSHSSKFFSNSSEERTDEQAQIGEDGDSYARWNKKRYFLDPYINKSFLYEDNSSNSGDSRFDATQNLLEWLSETCNVTVTGYFVFSKKHEFRNTAYAIMGTKAYHSTDELWKQTRKQGHVVECKGYNKLFLTYASKLATAGDDELDEEYIGANKNRVMAAFKRNQKGKTTSRFLVNEFIKEIA